MNWLCCYAAWQFIIHNNEALFPYTSFPSFSKSLRDLLCVTIYTPRNTSAMAIPFPD